MTSEEEERSFVEAARRAKRATLEAAGIPAFAYGPGLLTVSHGPQEFVPVAKITEVALIYALTAVRLLGKDQYL